MWLYHCSHHIDFNFRSIVHGIHHREVYYENQLKQFLGASIPCQPASLALPYFQGTKACLQASIPKRVFLYYVFVGVQWGNWAALLGWTVRIYACRLRRDTWRITWHGTVMPGKRYHVVFQYMLHSTLIGGNIINEVFMCITNVYILIIVRYHVVDWTPFASRVVPCCCGRPTHIHLLPPAGGNILCIHVRYYDYSSLTLANANAIVTIRTH